MGETLSQPSRSRRASQAGSPDRKVKKGKKKKKKVKGGAEESDEGGKKKRRKKKLVKKTKRGKSKGRVRTVKVPRDRSPGYTASPLGSRVTSPLAAEYGAGGLGLTEDDSNAFNAAQAYKSMLVRYQGDVESVNPEELRMARAEAVRLQALARHHARQRAEAAARKRFEEEEAARRRLEEAERAERERRKNELREEVEAQIRQELAAEREAHRKALAEAQALAASAAAQAREAAEAVNRRAAAEAASRAAAAAAEEAARQAREDARSTNGHSRHGRRGSVDTASHSRSHGSRRRGSHSGNHRDRRDRERRDRDRRDRDRDSRSRRRNRRGSDGGTDSDSSSAASGAWVARDAPVTDALLRSHSPRLLRTPDSEWPGVGTALLEGVPVAGGDPIDVVGGAEPAAVVVLDKTKEVELQLKLRALQARAEEAQAQVCAVHQVSLVPGTPALTRGRSAAAPRRTRAARLSC